VNKPIFRVFLLGGIGNQLFGTYFAHALNQTIPNCAELSPKMIPFGSNPSRRLVVNKVQAAMTDKLKVKKEIHSIWRFISHFRITRRILWHSYRLLTRRRRITLREFWSLSNIPRSGFEVLDYCNDWFFPEFVRNSNMEEGSAIPEKSDLTGNAKSSREIICHVRIGDYLDFPETYRLISDQYYLSSIEHIRKMSQSNLAVTVITESREEVEKHFPALAKISARFIDNSSDKSGIDSFQLMVASNYLVAANSTYSLWAAWLGYKSRSVTIVPYDDASLDLTGIKNIPWLLRDSQSGLAIQNESYDSWYQAKLRDFARVFNIFN
jgi:hypothetical protein